MNSNSLSYSEEILPSQNERQVTAKSQSNFTMAFWFLSKRQRQAMTSFYAFSRVVDDAVDLSDGHEAERLLAFWRSEVEHCYGGVPMHPIGVAMQRTIRDFEIPKRYLDLLLEGCQMDLKKHRYADFEELKGYCYRVASTIGLVCMKIFGVAGELADQAAEELGMALQLTNILRDVAEDAERGRIYLPQEDLARYRVTEADLFAGKVKPNVHLLLKLQGERAQTYFHRAFTKMEKLPRKPLLAAWIMGQTYQALLAQIRGSQYNVFVKRHVLSKGKKLQIAGMELLRSLRKSSF